MGALQQAVRQYKQISSSLQWLKILHGRSPEGSFISIEHLGENRSQYMLTNSKLSNARLEEATRGMSEDIYQTINPLYSFRSRRQASNVASINWLWVDIDGGDGSTEWIYFTLMKLEALGLPQPTIRLYSGRGLWVMWAIDPISANPRSPQYKQWEKVQDALGKKLEPLGADLGAKDASRLCRVVGTKNSKSGSKVRADYLQEASYTLEDFGAYLPATEKRKTSANSPPALKAKEKPKKKPAGKTRYLFNEYTMHRSRAQDIYNLIQMRQGDMSGMRDKALFIYGTTILKLVDNEEQMNAALEGLNSLFDRPLRDKEIQNISKGIMRYDKEFKWRTATVQEWLAITDAEQRQMKFLISKEEKKRRNTVTRREKRGGKTLAAYQADRVRAQMEKVAQVREATQKNPTLSNRAIAAELGISEATVRRIKSKL